MIIRAAPGRDQHNVILGPPELLYTALAGMEVDSSGWLKCGMKPWPYIPESIAMAEKGFVYSEILPHATYQDWGLLELYVNYPNGSPFDATCFIAPYIHGASRFGGNHITVPKGDPNLLGLLRSPVRRRISSEFPEFTPFYEDFLKYKHARYP
jgi:hypothetical protein